MSECKNIITIGREFGAGGRTVAKRISETLGIPYYDKEIITMTAEHSGISEDLLHGTEDRDTARSLFSWFLPGSAASSYDRAILAQAQTIRQMAEKGPCVIVGRAADYILRDFPNLVNVFLYAEQGDKIRYAMDTFGDTREMAIRRVRNTDTARESYYHYLTKGKWGNLTNYHLSLNSSFIGKEACADLVMQYSAHLK